MGDLRERPDRRNVTNSIVRRDLMDMEDLADGIALWQEHRPRTREDWLRIARRWHEQRMAPPENPSPLFGALYDAVALTDEMVERAAREEHAHSDHRMPSGELSNWDMLTSFQRDQFRVQARRVLTVALHWQQQSNEGENA